MPHTVLFVRLELRLEFKPRGGTSQNAPKGICSTLDCWHMPNPMPRQSSSDSSSINRIACRTIKRSAPLLEAGVHIFGTCSPPKPPSSWGSCRYRRRCIQQGKPRSWELAARQLRRCRHTSCKRPCRYLPPRQAAVACRRVMLLRGQLCRRRRPSRSAARPLPQCTPPGCRTHTAVCQQSIEMCNFWLSTLGIVLRAINEMNTYNNEARVVMPDTLDLSI